ERVTGGAQTPPAGVGGVGPVAGRPLRRRGRADGGLAQPGDRPARLSAAVRQPRAPEPGGGRAGADHRPRAGPTGARDARIPPGDGPVIRKPPAWVVPVRRRFVHVPTRLQSASARRSRPLSRLRPTLPSRTGFPFGGGLRICIGGRFATWSVSLMWSAAPRRRGDAGPDCRRNSGRPRPILRAARTVGAHPGGGAASAAATKLVAVRRG